MDWRKIKVGMRVFYTEDKVYYKPHYTWSKYEQSDLKVSGRTKSIDIKWDDTKKIDRNWQKSLAENNGKEYLNFRKAEFEEDFDKLLK